MKTGSTRSEIYLNSECALFAKFFTYLKGLDREVDEEDVRKRDFEGNTADVVWMNQQLFNILAQKTKGNPFQTLKNMADDEGCSGAGAWVKLLRAYKGKNASNSQRLTERVHDIKRVTSYSDVLPRMEKWEAALANCLRRLVPTDLYADLQNMSHIVLYSDVKRYIIDQVGLRICHDPRRQKIEHQGPVSMDTSLAETHYDEESGAPQDNEDPELNALKGKGQGFKRQCFHCGQYGHKLSEYRKKDADMMKGKGKALGNCELHGKPIDPNSLISPRLSVLAIGWSWSLSFCQQVQVHVGCLGGLQEIAAKHDRRAAILLLSCSPQHAFHVDNFACIGLDAKQVQLQTDKIAETNRAAGLSVHLVTKSRSKVEFLGLSLDGVDGRVSVKNRRIWMIELAVEIALTRNALLGASVRRLVGHLSYAFLLRVHVSQFFQARTPLLMRTLARSPSC